MWSTIRSMKMQAFRGMDVGGVRGRVGQRCGSGQRRIGRLQLQLNLERLEDRRLLSGDLQAVSTGLVYNRLTKLFNGSITLTNTGATAAQEPIQVELQGLPAGVTLVNATGNSSSGDPYIDVTGGQLSPGQSVRVPVQFKDPSFTPIHYTVLVTAAQQEVSFTLFVNPDDPELLRAKTPDGDVITYFGAKDANGVPTALTSAVVQPASGGTNIVRFDDQERPVDVLDSDGSELQFSYPSSTQVLVTAVTADGTLHLVNVPVDLPGMHIRSDASPTVAGSRGLVSGLVRHTNPTAVPPGTVVAAGGPETTTCGTVTLQICDVPINDASIYVSALAGGSAPQSEGFMTQATRTGDGTYQYCFTTTPSGLGDKFKNQICDHLGELLSVFCSSEVINSGPVICTVLGAASGAAAPLVVSACTAAFATLDTVCLGGALSNSAAGDTAQYICNNISSYLDAISNTNYYITASTTLPGFPNLSTSASWSAGSGLPSLNLRGGNGSPQVISFDVTGHVDPYEPYNDDFEGVAVFGCTPPGGYNGMAVWDPTNQDPFGQFCTTQGSVCRVTTVTDRGFYYYTSTVLHQYLSFVATPAGGKSVVWVQYSIP